MASGIINTSLQLSGALGVAVLGTVATERTARLLSGGHPSVDALLGGYQLAFLVAAGCTGAAVLATLLTVRGRRASVADEPPVEDAAAAVEAEAA